MGHDVPHMRTFRGTNVADFARAGRNRPLHGEGVLGDNLALVEQKWQIHPSVEVASDVFPLPQA